MGRDPLKEVALWFKDRGSLARTVSTGVSLHEAFAPRKEFYPYGKQRGREAAPDR